MNKKILGVAALATLSTLSLASCGEKDTRPVIDAIILYKSDNGMTYRQQDSTTLVNGQKVKIGDMLPTWVELQNKFGVRFNDAADYSQSSTKNAVNKYMQDGYKGVKGEAVDLVMSTNSQTKDMANAKKLIALSDHLDQMPNFKAYLDSHPSIKAQLTQADGKIYSTPYFDGVDSVEKYLMMNADFVTKLLDGDSVPTGLDTATVINAAYTEFYGDVSGEKITVVNKEHNGSYELVVGKTTNSSAITAQNAKGTLNGVNTVTALRNYIDEAYRYNDELKALYPNRSDVFLSASACYNVDDLVALYRAVKTNPQYLTGTDTVNVFFTRNGEANRQKGVIELASFFGVRGISAESEKFYFDKNGELQDARINEDTYKAFQKLNQMYQEGLIIDNYDKGFGGVPKNEWRKEFLSKGTGFSSYDYTGTTSPYCGEGTATPNYTAVLPPVAKWDVEEGPNGEDLNNFFHFSEDARALKDGGWVVPTTCDDAVLDKVLAIMDYMFTDEGADLQDYGPNTTDFRKAVTTYDENGNRVDPDPNSTDDGVMIVNNKTSVVIADKVLEDMKARSKNWNDYYRQFVGSTQGIGHIRSDGLDYQNMGASLQAGMENVSLAIKYGSMYITVTSTTGTFFSCVPSTFALQPNETTTIDANCKYFADLWKEDSSNSTCGYTPLIKDASKISDAAIAAILSSTNVDPINQYYLPAYRRAYADSMENLESLK